MKPIQWVLWAVHWDTRMDIGQPAFWIVGGPVDRSYMPNVNALGLFHEQSLHHFVATYRGNNLGSLTDIGFIVI